MKCPHCDTTISDHAASRCLDAWVAEVVMDYSFKDEVLILKPPDEQPIRAEWFKMHSPHYSTEISEAWEVVEKFNGRLALQGPGSVDLNEYYWRADEWRANLTDSVDTEADASTAPLAISRSAIKASHD